MHTNVIYSQKMDDTGMLLMKVLFVLIIIVYVIYTLI